MEMLGRYTIEGRLGEGAMADVYRARDESIGRTVAIKVLKPELARDPELRERFLREARAAGGLNHPAIATIYDVGEVNGASYIAMELVAGQPLDAVLQSHGRLPSERVLMLAEQIAGALAYAHKAGIVHRDVKPSNILLAADGQSAKLVDFGVARIADLEGAAAERQLARTQVGQMIGTPRYMSPEQALGLPVDARSDLFSFGVVLYEMVTGKVAFPGSSLATLAIQIAQDRVEPIDRAAGGCSPGLRFIIDKLLAKKPEARFADGDALVRALQRERQASSEAAPVRRGLPIRVKLPLALATVTALALGVSITAILDRQQDTLQQMAVVSGSSIAGFVTQNAAVLAADNAGLPPDQQDWSALQAFVTTAARDGGIRGITVVDTAGVVRASDDPSLVGRHYRQPVGEARLPATGGATVSAAPADTKGPGIRFVQPIRYAGARFGSVDLVLRRNALDAAQGQSRTLLAILSALVMAVVLTVGYLSGALVARPLRRLQRALDEAPGAGFALRLSHARRDELGAAFDAFNRAAAAIEPQLQQVTPERETALKETRIVPLPRRDAA